MSRKPPAYQWFLPHPGQPDPEPRWRVTYQTSDATGTFSVEVCAPDEDTAVMRAGMKRSAMHDLGTKLFRFARYEKWERINVENLTD